MLLACGLRRHEAVSLEMRHIQQREAHWAIVDLHGKAGHIHTVPMPDWVKDILDRWTNAAAITNGKIFRRVTKAGTTWGTGMTEKVVWHVVRECAAKAGISALTPHDLRRSCARLCHAAGGELDQIQFLLGHLSIQTTERYLGCKQRIKGAGNDRLGIERRRKARSTPDRDLSFVGTDRGLLRSVLGPWFPFPTCQASRGTISVEEHTSMAPRPRCQSQNPPLQEFSAIPA